MDRGSDRWKMKYVTMEVVDWSGPIVETSFHRPVHTAEEAEEFFKEGREFMLGVVRPKAEKAYFLTCYQNLEISRDLVRSFQEKLVAFNAEFSLGDGRWGGSDSAQMLIITTSIRASRGSNIYTERGQALGALREQVAREAQLR